jgi:hypothetical protein
LTNVNENLAVVKTDPLNESGTYVVSLIGVFFCAALERSYQFMSNYNDTEVVDSNGCSQPLDLMDLSIEVLANRPTISFFYDRPTYVVEGSVAELPLVFSGRYVSQNRNLLVSALNF